MRGQGDADDWAKQDKKQETGCTNDLQSTHTRTIRADGCITLKDGPGDRRQRGIFHAPGTTPQRWRRIIFHFGNVRRDCAGARIA